MKNNPITFEYSKPFRVSDGNIITMKALATIHGEQFVISIEDDRRYSVKELTPLTPEEYQAYLDDDFSE